jgi:hypothetical protein
MFCSYFSPKYVWKGCSVSDLKSLAKQVHLPISPFAASAYIPLLFQTTSSPTSLSKKEINHRDKKKSKISTSLRSFIANINPIGFPEVTWWDQRDRGDLMYSTLGYGHYKGEG